MPSEIAPLIPVIGTVAAALVAGGVARANLIASKETKISEFRQAWINALRDDLAALFSNVRTLARALEESQYPPEAIAAGFGIEASRITAARQGAAETYHRVRLRLNAGQDDHKELLGLIEAMMKAQQSYLNNPDGGANDAIDALERTSLFAERVLKTEWQTVKFGERAYRDAVRTTGHILRGAFAILALVVVGYPVYYYWPASTPSTLTPNPAPVVQPKAAGVGAPPAMSAPTNTAK